MITCVTWVPSEAAKEWPDKVHEIPIKNLPYEVDENMVLDEETVQQFIDAEQETDHEEDDNNDSKQNSRKRKLDDIENTESDNHDSKKQKLNSNITSIENDDHHNNDADDEEDEQDEQDEDGESGSDDNRYADIEDADEFTQAVLKGYDDDEDQENEPALDFISRIAGLHSGIGVGPTSYGYDSSKKQNRWKRKRDRIIDSENIIDTKNDSEIEDIHIKKTDELFVCLGCDEDRESSSLQVYVFDTELRTFYEHHDVILAAFPLCCTCLSYPRLGKNLCAVGSVEESIEIFDLDVMDALHPVCSLGGRVQSEKGEKLLAKWNEDITFDYTAMSAEQKQMTLGALQAGSHSDSVLCLEWSALNDHCLLSGSADQTVKLWDLNVEQCALTISGYHSDKVQQIKLKPNDANTLLSGGFDRNVFLFDVRDCADFNRKQQKHKEHRLQQWQAGGEIECLCWHSSNEHLFVATLDNGSMECYDIRKETEPIWTMKAHHKAVTGIAFNAEKPELFATGSVDKKIKIWYQDESDSRPRLLSKHSSTGVGNVFSIAFAPKEKIPSVLLVGGDQNFGIWDIQCDEAVAKHYQQINGDDEQEEDDKETEQKKQGEQKGGVHQHLIMEQTFNYKQSNKIVIDHKNTDTQLDSFLDDDE